MINRLREMNRALLELDLGILFCGAVCQLVGIWFAGHKGMYGAALWLGILEDMGTPAETFMDGMDGTLLQGFCRKFLFSFLQRERGTSPDPPQEMQGRTSDFT